MGHSPGCLERAFALSSAEVGRAAMGQPLFLGLHQCRPVDPSLKSPHKHFHLLQSWEELSAYSLTWPNPIC